MVLASGARALELSQAERRKGIAGFGGLLRVIIDVRVGRHASCTAL